MQFAAEVDLVPRSESARSARLEVHKALAGMEPALRQDAELVVSELVTNAVVHAGNGAIRLRVWLQLGRCRFEVSDCSSDLPEPYPLDVDSPRGRGLHLIEAIGAAWGAFSPERRTSSTAEKRLVFMVASVLKRFQDRRGEALRHGDIVEASVTELG